MALITSLTVAVGTTLLLFALSVIPAFEARADRTAWADEIFGVQSGGSPTTRTIVATSADHYAADTIQVVLVAGEGPTAPVPPGIPALPRNDESYVSPALASLMLHAPHLATRYGEVVGTVGDVALEGPDQLLVIRGVDETTASLSGSPVTAFATEGDVLELTGVVRLLILVGGVAMLVPVALLISIATRLAAASREARSALLRLAGASRRQIVQLAAIDALLAGTSGTAVGFLLFYQTRPLGAYVSYESGRWFASDLSPSLPALAFVALMVPLATAAAAVATLARAARSPLRVSRRTTASHVTPWRIVPVALMLPVLAYTLAMDTARQSTGGQGGLVVASFAALIVSLLVAGPWLTQLTGRTVARSGRPSLLLAGRRLADDPRGGFRAVAGAALAVLVTTLFVTVTPAAAESLTSTDITGQSAGTAQGSLFLAAPQQSEELLPAIRRVDGIASATLVYEGQVQTSRGPQGVWIGDCSAMTRAARMASVPCSVGPVLVAEDARSLVASDEDALELTNLAGVELEPLTSARGSDEDISSLDVGMAAAATMPSQKGIDLPDIILSPDVLGKHLPRLRPTLLLFEYRTGAALEEARTLLVQQVPAGSVSTRETTFDGYSSDVRRLYRVLAIAVLGMFALAGCTSVVAVSIGLLERRRPFALLRATGTPIRTLRRTLLVEAIAPLIVLCTFATALAVGVGRLIVRSGRETDADLPVLLVLAPVLVGVLICMAVVASALPLVGRVTRTAETRFD